MAVDLTPEGISMLLSGTYTTTIKPVLQVIDIKCSHTRTRVSSNGVENRSAYEIALSDGSVFKDGISNYMINEMIRSNKLQKGSIVQLTDYSSNTNSYGNPYISVYNLKVIRYNCVILGDPKPFPGNKTPPVEDFILPKLEEEPLYGDQKCFSCSQTPSRKRQCQSSDYKVDDEIDACFEQMEKLKEGDEIGACFEKMEKLGWEEGPMYDTAVLLFGESSDYRKIWLHVKPNSCENWVKNAGRKYGLLG